MYTHSAKTVKYIPGSLNEPLFLITLRVTRQKMYNHTQISTRDHLGVTGKRGPINEPTLLRECAKMTPFSQAITRLLKPRVYNKNRVYNTILDVQDSG